MDGSLQMGLSLLEKNAYETQGKNRLSPNINTGDYIPDLIWTRGIILKPELARTFCARFLDFWTLDETAFD